MSKLKQILKRIKRKLRKAYVAFSVRALDFHDWILDRRICGRSLGKIVLDMCGDEKNQTGGTGTESSHYVYLKRIFSYVKLRATDTVLDVGCGKGRVFAFFLKEKYPCRIDGIEHNPDVAKIAQEWTAKYPQIRVTIGDAFLQDFNQYTVLTCSRPFFLHTFCAFIEKLEEVLTHPITLVSWHEDPRLRDFVKVRPGWHIVHHEFTNRIHGLYLRSCPQPFTVWTYDPQQRRTDGRENGEQDAIPQEPQITEARTDK